MRVLKVDLKGMHWRVTESSQWDRSGSAGNTHIQPSRTVDAGESRACDLCAASVAPLDGAVGEMVAQSGRINCTDLLKCAWQTGGITRSSVRACRAPIEPFAAACLLVAPMVVLAARHGVASIDFGDGLATVGAQTTVRLLVGFILLELSESSHGSFNALIQSFLSQRLLAADTRHVSLPTAPQPCMPTLHG